MMKINAADCRLSADRHFLYGNVSRKRVGFVNTKRIAGRPPIKYDLC